MKRMVLAQFIAEIKRNFVIFAIQTGIKKIEKKNFHYSESWGLYFFDSSAILSTSDMICA